MPLDDQTALKIEELKEVGHEYRYRDLMMVQEFSLSVLATGVLLSAIAARPATNLAFVLQCFGLGFLCILTLHLRNTNQDRRAALHTKATILAALGFQQIHLNVDQRSRRFISVSAPRTMIWFAASATVGWAIWTIVEGIKLLCRHI